MNMSNLQQMFQQYSNYITQFIQYLKAMGQTKEQVKQQAKAMYDDIIRRIDQVYT